MTFADRVAALAPLGLPPRQTAFVATVALHGGYCLRRQFDTFVGCRRGGMVGRSLFATLVDRGLATTIRYRGDAGCVYHLHAKPLYRALNQDDNRNRRVVSPASIARKLMVLDYVLSQPSADWLATEQDKVEWFKACGVVPADLPQRQYSSRKGSRKGARPDTTRYFVNKQPIGVLPTRDRVVFVHLVKDETGRHFEQFLNDHVRLLSRVAAWTIVLVCPPHLRNGLKESAEVFDRMFLHQRPVASIVGHDDLIWFFRARSAVERRDLREFSVADLDRYRDQQRVLTTAEVERLYAEWQRIGDAALAQADRAVAFADLRARLVVHELPWRYHQFGALPGVA
jgi:hypothetical protein